MTRTEWVPGWASLLLLVEATVGETKVEGAEIIGFDPDRGYYATLYQVIDGPTAYEADLHGDGCRSRLGDAECDQQLPRSFNAVGELITGHCELPFVTTLVPAWLAMRPTPVEAAAVV
jgi:hypothetical protein